MPSIRELLETALRHQQAGRFYAAAQIYQEVLATDPRQADAWHLLGTIASQTGKHAAAVEYIERAISLKGTVALFHNSLGNVHAALGKPDLAVADYARALELKPAYAEAHNNLGNALRLQGKWSDAVDAFRRALALKPDYAEACNNLGTALQARGQIDDALAALRKAVELKPDLAEAHTNLGLILRDLDRRDEAVAALRRALGLKPNLATAHSALGKILRGHGNADEAVAACRRAVEARPDSAAAHNDLGNAYADCGEWDRAINQYRRALAIQPDFPEAHSNLGLTFQNQGKYREALDCHNRALGLRPDHAPAHSNRALVWLLTGDFERGWPEYEWRWRTPNRSPRKFSQPLWQGEPLAGRTILLHAEQGLGDTFHFIRYAALVKERGATVVVECQPPLSRILADCPSIDRLIAVGGELPPFDVHAPLMSLPGIFKTTLETIPAHVPYLHANPALIESWRVRLKSITGFKIGIAWQGNVRNPEDRVRSIPLSWFTALAEIPGVCLISLQQYAGETERAPIVMYVDELDRHTGPFMDTAAIMKNLDLVIVPDTSLAHLAGALGVPVWVGLSAAASWRWMLDRPDSPWYPTMRLFRQRELGDWAGVFAEMKAALMPLILGESPRI